MLRELTQQKNAASKYFFLLLQQEMVGKQKERTHALELYVKTI
jgi:hypothetical protein